jgi:hypothetical protein
VQRRGPSTLRAGVMTIAKQLNETRIFRDTARFRMMIETRKSIVAHWMKVVDSLDAQGEVVLAGDVRYFAKHLPYCCAVIGARPECNTLSTDWIISSSYRVIW